jgi:hypothetical protein
MEVLFDIQPEPLAERRQHVAPGVVGVWQFDLPSVDNWSPLNRWSR